MSDKTSKPGSGIIIASYIISSLSVFIAVGINPSSIYVILSSILGVVLLKSLFVLCFKVFSNKVVKHSDDVWIYIDSTSKNRYIVTLIFSFLSAMSIPLFAKVVPTGPAFIIGILLAFLMKEVTKYIYLKYIHPEEGKTIPLNSQSFRKNIPGTSEFNTQCSKIKFMVFGESEGNKCKS